MNTPDQRLLGFATPPSWAGGPPEADRSAPEFDGDTYDPRTDHKRLQSAQGRVWLLMRDGKPRGLAEIARATGVPEASVSARLRDFNKPKFRALFHSRMTSTNHGGGRWTYQLETPQRFRTDPPKPQRNA